MTFKQNGPISSSGNIMDFKQNGLRKQKPLKVKTLLLIVVIEGGRRSPIS